MKILQVCPKYYPSLGGVEEHVRNISERLAKQHQVTVFAGDSSGKLPREEEINGVLVRRFKSFSPGDAYHLSFEMAQALRKSRFDIVHGYNYHALPLYFSRYAEAKKFIVKTSYHGHGHTPLRGFLLMMYRLLGRRIFEAADVVIAASRHEKTLLLKDFNVDEANITIIPNGVNLAEFSNMGTISREPKIILCIGRLEKYKGVQYIVQSLPLLGKGFRLEIVGKGPYKANLITQVDELGLENKVNFYQDLPREELLKMYARAGVFVLLSRHEAFSNVVAEALAAGTPCIVANASALSEWIDDRNCFGIDYPITNAKLAELIKAVAGKKVGDVKLWDWDKVAQRVVKLYEC